MKVLVTGGVRSGKSRHAEELVREAADGGAATYVAPGPTTDEDMDPDWAARVAAHRSRRPESWATAETRDLASAVRAGDGPVLVDCLGTWLTAVLDEEQAWDLTTGQLEELVARRTDDVVAALAARDQRGGPRRRARASLRPRLPRPPRGGQPAARRRLRRGAPRDRRSGPGPLNPRPCASDASAVRE